MCGRYDKSMLIKRNIWQGKFYIQLNSQVNEYVWLIRPQSRLSAVWGSALKHHELIDQFAGEFQSCPRHFRIGLPVRITMCLHYKMHCREIVQFRFIDP